MAGSWHGRFREDPKSLWPLCLPLSFHEQSGPTAVVLTRVHLRFHGFGNPGADLLVAMLVPSRMECARLFSKIGTQNTLESRSATPVVAAATASGSTTEASKRFPYKARRAMAAIPGNNSMIPPENVVMGVPKKGRLYDRCMKLLAGAGMDHRRVSGGALSCCHFFETRLSLKLAARQAGPTTMPTDCSVPLCGICPVQPLLQ